MVIRAEKNDIISASLSQVGLVCGSGANIPEPELCHSFIVFLLIVWLGVNSYSPRRAIISNMNLGYDLICHNIAYSLITSQALW